MTKGFLESIEEDVVRMLKRGPLSEVQIACALMAELDQVAQVLRELEDKGKVVKTTNDPDNLSEEGFNLQVWKIAA